MSNYHRCVLLAALFLHMATDPLHIYTTYEWLELLCKAVPSLHFQVICDLDSKASKLTLQAANGSEGEWLLYIGAQAPETLVSPCPR